MDFMSFQMLFFHSRVKEFYNKLSKDEIKIIFAITFSILFITSGLRGMVSQGFNRASFVNNYPNNIWYLNFSLNIVYFFTGFIIEVAFFVLLILFHRLIYTNNAFKTNLNEVDIIILMQLSIFTDLLYLVYIFVQISSNPQYVHSWGSISDARTMDLSLYMVLLILVIFFMVPRIIPRLEISRKDYNRGLLYSLFISIAIVVSVSVALSIFKLILFIPFST